MATIDECHASMGAMIFAFQELEHELVKIFVHLIGPAELQKLSKKYVSFGRVMVLLVELTEQKLKDKTTKKRLKAMVDRALQFADKRNTYVHSHFDLVSWNWKGIAKFAREKGQFAGDRKKHEPQHESFKPEALYDLAKDISKRVRPVMRIHEKISDELHPGWREEEFKREMEMELYYDQMEVPEEIYESFREFQQHIQVCSVKLPG